MYAHSVIAIAHRFGKDKDFVYANGEMVKMALLDLEALNFAVHSNPKFKGIGISKESVTYFSDGELGVFFRTDKLHPWPLNTRQRAVWALNKLIVSGLLAEEIDIKVLSAERSYLREILTNPL